MKEDWIINYLKEYNNMEQLPQRNNEDLIRILMNITVPVDLSDEFYEKQDSYLESRNNSKNIVDSFEFNRSIEIDLSLRMKNLNATSRDIEIFLGK